MMKGFGMPRPRASIFGCVDSSSSLDGDISFCAAQHTFFHALFSNGWNKSNSGHVSGRSLSLCQQL